MKPYAIFADKFHNYAIVEERTCRPYYGAPKQKCYRVILQDYEGFTYHISVHETATDAMEKLKSFSCGSWQEVA